MALHSLFLQISEICDCRMRCWGTDCNGLRYLEAHDHCGQRLIAAVFDRMFYSGRQISEIVLPQRVHFVLITQTARSAQDEVNLFTTVVDLGVAITFRTQRDLSKP